MFVEPYFNSAPREEIVRRLHRAACSSTGREIDYRAFKTWVTENTLYGDFTL